MVSPVIAMLSVLRTPCTKPTVCHPATSCAVRRATCGAGARRGRGCNPESGLLSLARARGGREERGCSVGAAWVQRGCSRAGHVQPESVSPRPWKCLRSVWEVSGKCPASRLRGLGDKGGDALRAAGQAAEVGVVALQRVLEERREHLLRHPSLGPDNLGSSREVWGERPTPPPRADGPSRPSVSFRQSSKEPKRRKERATRASTAHRSSRSCPLLPAGRFLDGSSRAPRWDARADGRRCPRRARRERPRRRGPPRGWSAAAARALPPTRAAPGSTSAAPSSRRRRERTASGLQRHDGAQQCAVVTSIWGGL